MWILPCDWLITTGKKHICCSLTYKCSLTWWSDESCRKGKASEKVPQELRESQASQYKKSVQSYKGNTLTLLFYLDLCSDFTFEHLGNDFSGNKKSKWITFSKHLHKQTSKQKTNKQIKTMILWQLYTSYCIKLEFQIFLPELILVH